MTRLNPKIIPSNAEYCSYCKSKKYSNITTHSSSVKKNKKPRYINHNKETYT